MIFYHTHYIFLCRSFQPIRASFRFSTTQSLMSGQLGHWRMKYSVVRTHSMGEWQHLAGNCRMTPMPRKICQIFPVRWWLFEDSITRVVWICNWLNNGIIVLLSVVLLSLMWMAITCVIISRFSTELNWTELFVDQVRRIMRGGLMCRTSLWSSVLWLPFETLAILFTLHGLSSPSCRSTYRAKAALMLVLSYC